MLRPPGFTLSLPLISASCTVGQAYLERDLCAAKGSWPALIKGAQLFTHAEARSMPRCFQPAYMNFNFSIS